MEMIGVDENDNKPELEDASHDYAREHIESQKFSETSLSSRFFNTCETSLTGLFSSLVRLVSQTYFPV